MRHARSWIVLLLAPALPCVVLSQEPAANRVASVVDEQLRSLWGNDPAKLPGAITLVARNGVWAEGHAYRNSSDWLALSCTSVACTLEPAELSVKQESLQRRYDDTPTAGQRLTFTAAASSGRVVVAWLRQSARASWLKPGAVTTYYSAAGYLLHAETGGTLDAAVELPGGDTAALVPLELVSGESYVLQLRQHAQRQLLARLETCIGDAPSAGYLLWAGDIDRDGNPDYLVNFGGLGLFLSTARKPGELVGLGGGYPATDTGGCD